MNRGLKEVRQHREAAGICGYIERPDEQGTESAAPHYFARWFEIRYIERPDEQGTESRSDSVNNAFSAAVTLRDPMNRGLKVLYSALFRKILLSYIERPDEQGTESSRSNQSPRALIEG